jgi:hypothetical protein
MRRRTNVWLAFAFAVVAAGDLRAEGFLISDPDRTRTGMVFDFAGQNLYIATITGVIKTFHLSTHTFGRTYNLGGALWGIDIARDDSFILAAQHYFGTSEGVFQRVDLATGTITNINYTRAAGEGGGWYVAIGSNGLALASTQFDGSGWTPLRQIDLGTNTSTIRTDPPASGSGGEVRGDTQIHRSADGTRLFFMESDISSGPLFTYSATTNTFGRSFNTNSILANHPNAVNRNGRLAAFSAYLPAIVLDTLPNFGHVHTFTSPGVYGREGGVAFDGVRDILYIVDSYSPQILAYSTTTFAELFTIPIGEDVGPGAFEFDTGTLVASADGRWLALETDSGIRVLQIPNAPPPPLPPTPAPCDFNNDSHPDYLLYNSTTRQTQIWYLNRNISIGSGSAPTLPAGWRVVGVADFNGNAHLDWLLFNPVTRATKIWYMGDRVRVGAASGPTLFAGWQLADLADFNRDGHPDYLLFNSATRSTGIWYMNDNVRVSASTGPALPSGWDLVAVADFNQDAYPDYLLYNASTRGTMVWYMRNNIRISSASGPTPPTGWQLVGAADFNGDGHPDYLLFNSTTRASMIWYINNNVRVGSDWAPTLPAGWMFATS